MKAIKILASALLLFTVISCGTINNLDKYDLTKGKIYFEEIVPAHVQSVEITYEDEYYDDSHDKKKKSSGEVFADIATDIASGFANAEVENKLRRAVKPDEVIKDVSTGIENSLIKYYNVEAEEDLRGDYQFIVTTTLDECKLVSSPGGLYLRVKSIVQITDRASGEIVWENSESNNAYLREDGYSNNKSLSEKRMSNVVKVVGLATITEEELANAVDSAGKEVGRLMAETLRESIVDARKKS